MLLTDSGTNISVFDLRHSEPRALPVVIRSFVTSCKAVDDQQQCLVAGDILVLCRCVDAAAKAAAVALALLVCVTSGSNGQVRVRSLI